MDPFENNTIRCRDAVYSVQGLIGAGRFSRVYQATASGTGKRVAVKALNNDGSSRPTKEAKELAVLNALRSSPVRARYVRVVDAIRLPTGTVCFVMERLGTTLQAVLHNIGPLPMSMCRPVVRQIAQGKGWPVTTHVSANDVHYSVSTTRGEGEVGPGHVNFLFRRPYRRAHCCYERVFVRLKVWRVCGTWASCTPTSSRTT